ncbi:hypothetical protein Elgi_05570 [Paenibacillus elgii]|nr:hypothetical protein Elgi_05570 [Paenibacillus elgii]
MASRIMGSNTNPPRENVKIIESIIGRSINENRNFNILFSELIIKYNVVKRRAIRYAA